MSNILQVGHCRYKTSASHQGCNRKWGEGGKKKANKAEKEIGSIFPSLPLKNKSLFYWKERKNNIIFLSSPNFLYNLLNIFLFSYPFVFSYSGRIQGSCPPPTPPPRSVKALNRLNAKKADMQYA